MINLIIFRLITLSIRKRGIRRIIEEERKINAKRNINVAGTVEIILRIISQAHQDQRSLMKEIEIIRRMITKINTSQIN